mgnify:CR=1 FL=1
MHASGNRYGSIGRLIVEAQGDARRRPSSTCSTARTPRLYWERESQPRHRSSASPTAGRRSTRSARVIEAWIAHFLRVERDGQADPEDRGGALGVAHRPRRRVDRDPERAVGAASEVEQGRMRRILALFRLEFADPR